MIVYLIKEVLESYKEKLLQIQKLRRQYPDDLKLAFEEKLLFLNLDSAIKAYWIARNREKVKNY